MPSTAGPNLGMQHSWALGESGWNGGMDGNLKKLDTVVQLSVKDRGLNTPPGSPVNGDRYIVGSAPTGAWSGHAQKVAVWDSVAGAWVLYTAGTGWMAWVDDEQRIYVFRAGAWQLYAPGTAPGAAKYLWLPAGQFGTGTFALDSPLDEGTYEYLTLISAGDTRCNTTFVVPHDFASVSSWKLFFAMSAASTTTLTLTWGLAQWAADGENADELASLAVLSLTPQGQEQRLNVKTLTLPSITLVPGNVAKLYMERINSQDANPDDMRLIGFLLTYNSL